ncbi:hypothetical protein GC169_10545 [bacterium]|nr:hypothetical protein [bacterium]
MKRAAFLSATKIHSSTPNRRLGAEGYDLEVALLTRACAAHGLALEEVIWTDPDFDPRRYDVVLPLAVWDYQDRPAELLTLLDRAEAAGVPVFNSAAMVRWNLRKTYLRELQGLGAPVVPTVWCETPDAPSVKVAFDALGADELVIKRQVGAGAQGQLRLARADAPETGWVLDRPAMIQPFLSAIADEGEYSFLFVEGAFSHAVLKRPAAHDYRIQPQHGGVSLKVDPLPDDQDLAEHVLGLLDERPLYARVDMVRGDDDRLMLMELELIEPFLFPEQGPGFAPLLAKALARRLE